ncbi:MAG: hypothetical protein HQK73_08460 [Desulfamplus sp.]|nr:hypothetical protein [Desulfamplus sp.]MBF0413941.1 hypothetical protein [Desulfamplus sp.]
MNNNSEKIKKTLKYTCNEYREEMILASLRQRLSNKSLSPDEMQALINEIEKIESEMGF